MWFKYLGPCNQKFMSSPVALWGHGRWHDGKVLHFIPHCVPSRLGCVIWSSCLVIHLCFCYRQICISLTLHQLVEFLFYRVTTENHFSSVSISHLQHFPLLCSWSITNKWQFYSFLSLEHIAYCVLNHGTTFLQVSECYSAGHWAYTLMSFIVSAVLHRTCLT